MKKLKFYFVEFYENKIIKIKKYLFNCVIKSANYKVVIKIRQCASIFLKMIVFKELEQEKVIVFYNKKGENKP